MLVYRGQHGDEINSNFIRLLKLKDSAQIDSWLAKKKIIIPQQKFSFINWNPLKLAGSVMAKICDTMLWLNLSFSKVCGGQCYDGAASMPGVREGVATQITKEDPREVYAHCYNNYKYGHLLNLACSDTIKRCKVICDALDNVVYL